MVSKPKNANGSLSSEDSILAHVYLSSEPPGAKSIPLSNIAEEFGLADNEIADIAFHLREDGFIKHTEDGAFVLTEKGKARAKPITGVD